ncbi:hypothetical protein H310_01225 [Aphanomyces invadans]|uniref:Uncharacterized protein n=1 Tax=Aphanomyces invadans TaxID=157072 RepID=A0A024USP1_9STRA|nr:hypothetical protein H310_01225 [Aphanomyces invadans]ETW08698.1 hypothetical protein H310_01225 [Aphanomyces invadans]|eukprot:XP_008862503.1 hypothetical protein H310_01225 [Aphanomyces invadans]
MRSTSMATVAAVMLAAASIVAKTAKEICASPTCIRGGLETISMEKALLLAPCVGEDLKCFNYKEKETCPFDTTVDCSKIVQQTTTAPITMAPTSPAPTTTALTATPKATESESSGNYYPYIIGGGAVALIAIGALVFVLVRKSDRRNNQDDDDVEAAEYGKAIASQAKEEPPTSSYGYYQSGNKSFGEVPLHHTKATVNQDLRRQNTGSFVTPAQPIARPNTASFLQNNSHSVITSAPQPPVETKEQFYVPDTPLEYHHGAAGPGPEPNRRESFEF